MKVVYKEKIGGFNIVRLITDASVDPEETKKRIELLITEEMSEEDVERLYMENRVYSKVNPEEAELIEDTAAEQIQAKLDTKEEKQLLLDDGSYIYDFSGTEYWIKKSGKWQKDTIEVIGAHLPKGSILQENLTPEQNTEIAAQAEAERIISMSAEDKEKAKQAALDSLADEADRLDRRAKIQHTAFDPASWYSSRADEIEQKYA